MRALFWRSSVAGLGLLWLAIAANDVYQIVNDGGPLLWTLGAVHALVFFVLGVGTCLGAALVDPSYAREVMIDFARDVFSRKNLIEVGGIIALAVLVALVLATARH